MLHCDMSFRSASMTNTINRIGAALAMPWNMFVAAFLYYTVLAVLALGGASPGVPVVATAYLAPLVMYLVALGNRAAHAIAGLFSLGVSPVAQPSNAAR
jgi:hypothetical protein